jgi:hypothetical protein
LAAGCAYRTPPVHFARSIELAPEHLDVSTIAVLRDGSTPPEREVEEIDRWATEILQTAARERGSRDDAPARVWLRVEVEPQWHPPGMDPLSAGVVMIALALGLAPECREVSVVLELESQGRLAGGRGSGRACGGIYAPARRRALALALDDALAEVDASHAQEHGR